MTKFDVVIKAKNSTGKPCSWILACDDKTRSTDLVKAVAHFANLQGDLSTYFLANGSVDLPKDSTIINQGIKDKQVLELRQYMPEVLEEVAPATLEQQPKRSSLKSMSLKHRSVRLDEPLDFEQFKKDFEKKTSTSTANLMDAPPAEKSEKRKSLTVELIKTLKRLSVKL